MLRIDVKVEYGRKHKIYGNQLEDKWAIRNTAAAKYLLFSQI